MNVSVSGKISSDVFARLREDILSLRRPPGQILDEAELSEALGISRTPLRRILIQLASEDLIIMQPNRGAVVAPINLHDFPFFIEALSVVYGQTQALAARKPDTVSHRLLAEHADRFEEAVASEDFSAITDANTAFHLAIAEAARSRFLNNYAMNILNVGQRIARLSFGYYPPEDDELPPDEYLQGVVREHRAIVSAIVEEDDAEAWRLGVAHAELFRRRMMSLLRQNLARNLDGPA